MPLPSFLTNHKQNRSATALPAGNNASSSSLPSPHPHQQPQQHLQQQQQQLQQQQQQQQHPGGPPYSQQAYQAYSPPPESLSAQQQFAQAQAQIAAQQQQQQQQQGQVPARHQSISGAPPGAPYGRPEAGGIVPGGFARHPGSAAESQQTLLNDNPNADNLSYTSNSSTAYGSDQGVVPVPAKSTLRKPVLTKEPSGSSGHTGLGSLFSRHKHQDPQSQDGGGSSISIGRKSSTRKSNPPTPQQSPNIPQQIDENHYIQESRSRPQSLLPPSREQGDHLAALRRSDTDAQTYSQPRPAPPIQQPLAQPQQRPPSQPQGQPQPYYNITTGQYEPVPTSATTQSIIPPGQAHRQPQPQPQSPQHQREPPQQQNFQHQPPPQHQSQPPPQHQPPPQPSYPGHQTHPSQSKQIQQPPSFGRSSSELSAQDFKNIQVITNHPGGAPPGGLQTHPQNNPPVSPGASVHTVDTMPGNNPGVPGQSPAGPDGRATPTGPPAKGDGNGGSGMSSSQVQALMTEFDTLQSKYRKVKNLYFERAAEIERLQNTMANQRMSQSRTALDDNQYSSRFERLDGAIKNLAFEIRQSWKVIPGWLQPVVNPGAEVKGGREMTVVGRAAISRWVVDEILDRFFHPSLDPAVSSNLKSIENGIRRNSPQPHSIEEDDNLSSKVCAWRMATVDGIGPAINSEQGKANYQKLIEFLEEKLTASLAMHLKEPLPAGLSGGVKSIIELAVGIAANLPLESRDVRVWYPLPGEKFDSVFMRPETGLPPLLIPTETTEAGKATITVDGKPISQVDKGSTPPPLPKDDVAGLHPSNSVKSSTEPKKASVFKGIKGKLSGSSSNQQPQPGPPQNPSQTSLAENSALGMPTKTENAVPGPPPPMQAPPQQPGQEKVRVAGFMAVEVRGRSILIKAPVWT